MLTPRSAILLTVLLFGQVPSAASDDKTEPVPMFASDQVVEVTITAPFREIMRVRSIEEEAQGTLSYIDPEDGEIVLDIGIRTRGNFRRQRDVCPFAPIRLNFRKTKGTLFARSNKQKLVTHCRNGNARYTQVLLKEYLAYRILNLVTDKSFRVRLLRVTYVESNSGKTVDTNYAFLIEHNKQLAKRLGLKVDDSESTTVEALDAEHTNIVSLFQYLIGNTDFSPIKGMPGEPCCHNFVLLGDDSGPTLSVPYDFDIAGIVSAPYASPNPRFKLRNVRERLYRGRCVNNQHLAQSIELFQDNRQPIFDLVPSIPGLDDSSVRKVTSYIEDFYDAIDSPKLVNRRLVDRCLD